MCLCLIPRSTSLKRSKPCAHIYKGVIYATKANFPVVVPVPTHLDRFVASCTDDLDTSSWLNRGIVQTQGGFNLGDTSIVITHFPFDAPEPLPYSYSLLVAPQATLRGPRRLPFGELHPVNCLVRNRTLRPALQWRGNVLVMRHDKEGIVDIDEVDLALVDQIVSRYALLRSPGYTSDYPTARFGIAS